jgi:hypothetical protein
MPHTEPSLLHAVVQLARTYSDSGEGDTRKRISIRSRSGRLLNVDTVAEPDLTDVGMVPEPGQELGLIADDAAAGAGGDSMVGYYAQGTGELVLVGTYSEAGAVGSSAVPSSLSLSLSLSTAHAGLSTGHVNATDRHAATACTVPSPELLGRCAESRRLAARAASLRWSGGGGGGGGATVSTLTTGSVNRAGGETVVFRTEYGQTMVTTSRAGWAADGGGDCGGGAGAAGITAGMEGVVSAATKAEEEAEKQAWDDEGGWGFGDQEDYDEDDGWEVSPGSSPRAEAAAAASAGLAVPPVGASGLSLSVDCDDESPGQRGAERLEAAGLPMPSPTKYQNRPMPSASPTKCVPPAPPTPACPTRMGSVQLHRHRDSDLGGGFSYLSCLIAHICLLD